MSKLSTISKKDLSDLYEKQKLTTYQIAEKLNCCQATIWKRLRDFKIKSRLPGVKRVNITKKQLGDLYLNKKLSTWKIEHRLNVPRGTIHRKLREFNIKTRDLATANNKYPKKNFSGNLIEKAYLIGFRIGDLRVRKQCKNSKTICVACSSTIPEQTELIKKLFNEYGRVWIKKSNTCDITHSEAYLNESFEFLIPKDFPKWILKDKEVFLSFLAGFIDAEGNIGIYNKAARFSLGNYDSKILFLIYKILKKYGINGNLPFSDKRKGKKNSQGYVYNNDYWHFRILRKKDLMEFFKLIKPYVKHKNKIKALKKAENNILKRNIMKKNNG